MRERCDTAASASVVVVDDLDLDLDLHLHLDLAVVVAALVAVVVDVVGVFRCYKVVSVSFFRTLAQSLEFIDRAGRRAIQAPSAYRCLTGEDHWKSSYFLVCGGGGGNQEGYRVYATAV